MDIENDYEGKIVLVTGGAGCIGTNLCSKLAELNSEKVIILDDLSSAYEWNIPEGENIKFVKGSVLDDKMLKRVFKEKPDYVFHLAAHFIPNFFYWAMNKQALPITGDGTETRDWTYVDDIIYGLLAMGIKEEAVGEAINLGSGEEHRVIDLANMVNELVEAGVIYVERRDWDVKHRLLSSIDKAKKLLSYEPHMEFEDGLKRVHEWLVENWENIGKSAEF
jgi:nucleoside-diphosphate-sugar epimerase